VDEMRFLQKHLTTSRACGGWRRQVGRSHGLSCWRGRTGSETRYFDESEILHAWEWVRSAKHAENMPIDKSPLAPEYGRTTSGVHEPIALIRCRRKYQYASTSRFCGSDCGAVDWCLNRRSAWRDSQDVVGDLDAPVGISRFDRGDQLFECWGPGLPLTPSASSIRMT